MTTIYVDNIAPNLQSKVSAPNLTLPTGSVIQVQTGTNAGNYSSTTSASDTASGLKVTITPSATSNKIYISTTMGIQNGSVNGGTMIKLFRKIGSGTPQQVLVHGSDGLLQYSSGGNNVSLGGYVFLDSPNTTSAVEYEIYYSRYNTGTAYFFRDGQIVAMEIAG